MELKIVIDYGDNEENQLGVILEAYPHWQDDSYDDERGTVKIDPYPDIEELPTWNQKLYTLTENFIIAVYLTNNLKKITEQFCNLLREETIPDL